MNAEAVPRSPSGPRGLPLVGILPKARKDVLGFLLQTAREHGPVAQYRFGPLRSYLVSHPDGLKRVLQDNVKNYCKQHFSYSMIRYVVGDGLLTLEGDSWLRQRRLAQPAFHKNRIVAMADQMVRAANDVAERWSESAAKGEQRRMSSDMMALTMRIVGEALLGTDVRAETEAVGQSFGLLGDQLIERFRSLNLLPPILPTAYDRDARAAIKTIRAVVDRLIAQRRQKPIDDRGDLLSMFMLAKDEDTGEMMNDLQLRSEAMTMLIAGHETTATALTWAWRELSHNRDVEQKLHAELDAVLGGRLPTADDVPRLVYTRMFVDEVLRFYPPVYALSRKVVEDDVVCGYRLRGGCIVDLSPYVTHRDPEFWDEPEVFRPERFTPEEVAKRPRYAYFPFLGGPRQCIGNHFALMEATLILAVLAQRFRPRLVPGYTPKPEPLITLRASEGLPIVLERRSPRPNAETRPKPGSTPVTASCQPPTAGPVGTPPRQL